MSFHNTEFHETKSERKFYEGKKQKALTYIDHTIDFSSNTITAIVDTRTKDAVKMTQKLREIKKLVNDI